MINSQSKNGKIRIKTLSIIVMIVLGVIIAITVNIILGVIIGFFPIVINALLDVRKDISTVEEDIEKKAKEELAPKMIKSILLNAEYKPNEGINKNKYDLAEYTEQYDTYISDQKIKLDIFENNNTYVEFASLQLKKNKNEEKVFEGIVGIITLPKDIRSKIKINKNGTYEKDYIFRAGIDNQEFAKKFDVMALNKNLSKKLLTNELMDQILKIYNTYNYNIDISIIRNILSIRIESGPIIKTTNEGKQISRELMEKRYNMINDASEIIKMFVNTINNIEI